MGGRIGTGVGRGGGSTGGDSKGDASTSQATVNSLKDAAAISIAKEKTGFREPNAQEIEEAARYVKIERGILSDEQGEYSVYFAKDTRTGEIIRKSGWIIDGEKRNWRIDESEKTTYKNTEITDRPTR